MDSGWQCGEYEELRRKNVERNENFLQTLGLCPTRDDGDEEKKSFPVGGRSRSSKKKGELEPRRSVRIAARKVTSLQAEEVNCIETCGINPILKLNLTEGRQEASKIEVHEKFSGNCKEVIVYNTKMEYYDNKTEDCSTDESEDSFNDMNVDFHSDGKNQVPENSVKSDMHVESHPTSSSARSFDCSGAQGMSVLGSQIQEIVMRVLMQSSTSLVAPPGLQFSASLVSSGMPLLSTDCLQSPSTWTESAYNKSEARRRRKPQMNRTSTGENSDSQADFPLPENKTPQQRSLRTRRLNRSRAKRARELTSNRKALKKLPYVIHVDGTGKPKGIHRHLWRAAVRGQCGRLDPTMDNINHHAKHVVDSIWHSLQNEWEFQGFSHKAREMFEKGATKFMRNKKMQLKYKCLKQVEGTRPEEVSPINWEKIKDITKKTVKHSMPSASKEMTAKGKEKEVLHDVEEGEPPLLLLASEEIIQKDTTTTEGMNHLPLMEVEAVEAKILELKNELVRLQSSRNVSVGVSEKRGGLLVTPKVEVPVFSSSTSMVDVANENMNPRRSKGMVLQSSSKMCFERREGKSAAPKKAVALRQALKEVVVNQSAEDLKNIEVDCGDVVRLFSVVGGNEREIAKGIVMGLSGSKHARKVIPKGWRSIKVTASKITASNELCPVPTGWTEVLKEMTVKEAGGRTILWPDNLVRTLLQE